MKFPEKLTLETKIEITASFDLDIKSASSGGQIGFNVSSSASSKDFSNALAELSQFLAKYPNIFTSAEIKTQ